MEDKHPISDKEQVDEQQIYHFDDLIIQEILERLPIKSILRFKSVSKQWYSTLSSSNFVISHFMKSPFSHPSAPVNTLFVQSRSNCYLFNYNDDQISGNFEDNLVKLDPEFWVQKDELKLTGCCNGLICLTPLSNKYIIIWNPATRKMHKYETNWYKQCSVVSGFGYAASVDDYKYVRLPIDGLGSDQSDNVVHIFSLKENKWTRLDFVLQASVIICRPPVLINEVLHWPAFCFRARHQFILTFDLGVERFDRVNLDPGEYLGVMGGCLSKCKSSNANAGEIMLMHVLESPGVILKSIGVPDGLRLVMASQMIGFTRTGKFFVSRPLSDEIWDSQSKMLGIVDTVAKPMQYTTVLSFDETINIARYVPSLVSPLPVEELSSA